MEKTTAARGVQPDRDEEHCGHGQCDPVEERRCLPLVAPDELGEDPRGKRDERDASEEPDVEEEELPVDPLELGSAPSESWRSSGSPTSMTRSVAAIANTPSANVSSRPGVMPPRSAAARVVLRRFLLEELPHPVVEEHEADLVKAVR